eukprot:Awhi_evm1s8201
MDCITGTTSTMTIEEALNHVLENYDDLKNDFAYNGIVINLSNGISQTGTPSSAILAVESSLESK